MFHEILEELSASSSVRHWIFGVQMFVWHVMVVINGSLIQEFSWRFVAMTGAILVSLGFATSAFATSVVHLFFTYSILTGR